jgi:pimeloyl-ACP methyl ester carboxylesterase
MTPRRRPGRRLLKALLPLVLLPLVAAGGFALWLVYGVSRPQTGPYMMTPETFGLISERGLQVKEEKWTNRDGTEARGWLLRSTEGAPAVVMLHHYDSNRSAFLNLGVKINESSNFTILWPDLRGHGENPPVATTSFGAHEADDLLDALEFLRGLKTPQGKDLTGDRFGVYGVELGAYSALLAAPRAPQLKALVLDSAPDSADDILSRAVKARKGLDNDLIHALARLGARLYFLGAYQNTHGCTLVETLGDRRVLFTSGHDAGPLRTTTETLAKCFPNPANVELRSDLPLTGFTQSSAPGQQSEAYARVVIDFFVRALPPREP